MLGSTHHPEEMRWYLPQGTCCLKRKPQMMFKIRNTSGNKHIRKSQREQLTCFPFTLFTIPCHASEQSVKCVTGGCSSGHHPPVTMARTHQIPRSGVGSGRSKGARLLAGVRSSTQAFTPPADSQLIDCLLSSLCWTPGSSSPLLPQSFFCL